MTGEVCAQIIQATVIPFLFQLRAPSETMFLRRAYGDEPITQFVKQISEARIGALTLYGTILLVINFSYRATLPGRCFIRRPRRCSRGDTSPYAFFPAHTRCASARCRSGPDQPIFTQLNGGNFNTALKSVFSLLGAPGGERFSNPVFDAGPLVGSKNRDATLRMLPRSGVWNSKSMRWRIDIIQEE